MPKKPWPHRTPNCVSPKPGRPLKSFWHTSRPGTRQKTPWLIKQYAIYYNTGCQNTSHPGMGKLKNNTQKKSASGQKNWPWRMATAKQGYNEKQTTTM